MLPRITKATIDRLLARERKRPALKPKTKPGTLLKKDISIRTYADWKEDAPGFIGANSRGAHKQNFGAKEAPFDSDSQAKRVL